MSPRAKYWPEEADCSSVRIKAGKSAGSYDELKVTAEIHEKPDGRLRVWHDGDRWCVQSVDPIQFVHEREAVRDE